MAKTLTTAGRVADMVCDLARAVRGGAIYPPRHPTRERLLARVQRRVAGLIEDLGPVEIEVGSRGLTFAGDLLATRDGSEVFISGELFSRQVGVLRFLGGLTPGDMEGFLDLMKTQPDEVRQAGGAREYLVSHGVRGVQVEDVDYEGILQRREESTPERGGYADELEGAAGTPQEDATPGSPATFDDQGVPEVGQREWIERKLWELESARDFPTYKSVLRDIFLNLRSTGALNLPQFTEQVIRRLGRHLSEKRSEEMREVVSAAVRELAVPKVLEGLVASFTQRNIRDREALSAVFFAAPEKSIPALLTGLANEKGTFGRKALMNSLASLGGRVRPFLESWLADERWFVARNAIALLAEVGDERDAPAIQPFLSHENPRVRIEAIRFFTRHPVPGAERRLLALLHDPDPEVRSRAVFSLGSRGGRKAFSRLMQVAKKPFWGEGDVALRETAIRSLGRMGGEQSAAFLRSLLGKGGWVEPEEHSRIEAAAVDALIEAGGEPARSALAGSRSRLRGEALRAAEDYLRRAEEAER